GTPRRDAAGPPRSRPPRLGSNRSGDPLRRLRHHALRRDVADGDPGWHDAWPPRCDEPCRRRGVSGGRVDLGRSGAAWARPLLREALAARDIHFRRTYPMSAVTAATPRATLMSRSHFRLLSIAFVMLVAASTLFVWWFHPWSTGITEYPMPSASDIPTALAIGADGSVWFTIESSDAIGVLRQGNIRKLPKGKPSVEPMGIAVDAQGAVWFTDSPARAVSRMAPDGTVTSFALTGTPIAKLNRLALAPDGAIWFADSTALSVTRLRDGVFTPHVLASLRPNLYGVAVDRHGTVWATLQGINKLARITADGALT